MKQTITINQENNTQHIVYLDQKQVPLKIKPLPPTVAYQLENTPILITTTQTLQNTNIHTIGQKNKNILTKTILIIIQNTKTLPKLQIQTINENPNIQTHITNHKNLHKLLKQLITQNTNDTPITIKETPNQTYTLTQQNKKIKTYNNKTYTTLIQTILNTNPQLTLQEAEYQAQKQYYKNISYDKHNHTYKITHKNTTSTHKKLTHAIQEQNTITQNTEQEEETLCQNNYTTLEPLPPTPWNNTIHKLLHKTTNKYMTTKHKNDKTTTHHNPDTATLIQQTKPTKKQLTKIRNTQKPNRNIKEKNKQYYIIKIINKKQTTYYQTHDKNKARYIRDKLEQHQYKTTNKIKTYEKKYQKEKQQYQKQYTEQNEIIDYYQQTQTKLTQQHQIKEQYQNNLISKQTTIQHDTIQTEKQKKTPITSK